MRSWLKKHWITALGLLVCAVALMTAGCSLIKDPADRARVVTIQGALADIVREVKNLAPEIVEVVEIITDIKAKIEAKEIPVLEGLRLVEFYQEKKARLETAKQLALEKEKTLRLELKALQESGVPWWRVAAELIVGLGMSWLGVNRANAAKVATERAVKSETALGVVSRAADAAGPVGGEATPEFKAAVVAELARSDLTREDMMVYHAKARAGNIAA